MVASVQYLVQSHTLGRYFAVLGRFLLAIRCIMWMRIFLVGGCPNASAIQEVLMAALRNRPMYVIRGGFYLH